MITAKEARNNMKHSLQGVLEDLNTQIILRSRDNFDGMTLYGVPAGLVDKIIDVLVENGFEVTQDGHNTLEISW